MKISVCGKGGSGKSTIVTLLANESKVPSDEIPPKLREKLDERGSAAF